METFFIYLLQVNIGLMAACTIYFVWLRNLTFFKANRIYLMLSMLLSISLPIALKFISFSKPETTEFIRAYSVDWTSVVSTVNHPPEAAKFNWYSFLSWAYWIGAAIMGGLFLMQLVSLFRIHKSARQQQERDLYFSEKIKHPFSFIKNIYLNPLGLESSELYTVLHHERVHTHGLHSLDLFFAELTKLFFWFNPAAWLMKLAITENLEFIADNEVLNHGFNRKSYQYQLLSAFIQNNRLNNSLINSFSLIQLKQRVKMMNKERSGVFSSSKYLALIPIFFGICLLFVNTPQQAQNLKGKISKSSEKNPDSTFVRRRIGLKDNQTVNKAWAYTNGVVVDSIDFETALPVEKNKWMTKYDVTELPSAPPTAIAEVPAVREVAAISSELKPLSNLTEIHSPLQELQSPSKPLKPVQRLEHLARLEKLEKNPDSLAYLAEQNAKIAERNAQKAEQNTKIAEQNAMKTEQKAKVAEENARIAEKNAKKAEVQAAKNEQTMNAIIDDLIANNIVKSRKEIYSLKFNADELVVNNIKQPKALHEKFKNKYETSSMWSWGIIHHK